MTTIIFRMNLWELFVSKNMYLFVGLIRKTARSAKLSAKTVKNDFSRNTATIYKHVNHLDSFNSIQIQLNRIGNGWHRFMFAKWIDSKTTPSRFREHTITNWVAIFAWFSLYDMQYITNLIAVLNSISN